MNTDNLILRETDNLPLINKNDFLDNADFDGNFINIYNDFVSLQATDFVDAYNPSTNYQIGLYVVYDAKLWEAVDPSFTGVTPGTNTDYWIDVFPTILAHVKNSDLKLAEGTANEVTASEIRAFIDAGLTSTTNLSITTHTPDSLKINSSTGADITLFGSTVSLAGLLSSSDKIKLNSQSGTNTGDQSLTSLGGEATVNKATDFSILNHTLYPTVQAVETQITALVPALVTASLGGGLVDTTTAQTIDGVKTLSDSPIISSETVDTIAHFDATKNLKSLPLATYPSLTELAHVKGATSSIQDQIDNKANINPRTSTTASTPQLNVDFSYDYFEVTALAHNMSIDPTGVWARGKEVTLFIQDAGVSKALTWNAKFRPERITMPTATVANQIYIFKIIYDLTADKYSVIWLNYLSYARVQSITSASTVTATNEQDLIEITALAVGMELSNPTGAFTNGQLLEYKIKDNATPRTLTLGSNIRNFTTFGLITTASKWTRLIVEYNGTDTKWDIIGFNTQP